MKRRDFLKGAAIVPAAVAAARWPAMAEMIGARRSRIAAVVYDERYADCRMFAETLARQGAIALPTSGDAAHLWYGALREQLALRDGNVAGMTTDADLLVSRGCGREMNMRMVYEGSHDCRTSDHLKHRLRGSGIEREVYAALLRADAPWAEAIATALQRPPAAEQIVQALAGLPIVTTPQSADHPGYLSSWLQAPAIGPNWPTQS
ncbi:MAG TPA: twin-arginine translocation signal domain-containing protein [Candidatus Acidoferrum sp.]|nr:twin-arginine translocation signal domain-containing protein [Candidatus Acidoferrum sp.]